ncbi:MAG: 3-dehydroquinate synthase [Clostridia bacterium]|nr:3-dehydroquinate synthase [Clostridia bacterium]
MREVLINTNNPYTVYIGQDLLSKCGEYLNRVKQPCKVLVVCDDNVNKLYSTCVMDSLKDNGFDPFKHFFKSGEENKDIKNLEAILETLAKNNFNRSDLVLALGGGVCGDMAGFAAATYMRGMDFVQIPTSLLAMVDASVGGKTAVNLSSGKNLFGAFHQPKMVLCDIDTLKTLPEEEMKNGYAECIKHAFLADPTLLSKMDDLEDLIAQNIEIKASFVCGDEEDRDKRTALNFGHTIGHAIERASGFEISHGKAVAIGMCLELKAMGFDKVYEQLKAELLKYDLPCECELNFFDLKSELMNDKKISGKYITIPTVESIGSYQLITMDEAEYTQFIKRALI